MKKGADMESQKLTFTVDPADQAGMIALMDKYGDSEMPYSGSDEEGNDTLISIFHNRITILTFQTNGWVRQNNYWRDGVREELYKGRWDMPNNGMHMS